MNPATDPRGLAQMTPNERALARRWLELHAKEYDLIVFQNGLGESPVHKFTELGQVYEWQLTTWRPRPDFIAWRGDEWTIGEIKARVTFKAVAQLYHYGEVARNGTPAPKMLRLLMIGGSVAPGVEQALAHFEIHLDLLPEVKLIPLT